MSKNGLWLILGGYQNLVIYKFDGSNYVQNHNYQWTGYKENYLTDDFQYLIVSSRHQKKVYVFKFSEEE